jgi:YVTN family beta-propeller protein
MYINTLRRKLYVVNLDGGSVSVIDLATNQVVKTVPVGGNPNAGYYFRSADKFYSEASSGYIAVIDGVGDTVVARIPTPGGQTVLTMTGNEQASVVFVGMQGGNTGYLFAIAADADSVIYAHDLGLGAPWALHYSPETNRLYCGNAGTNEAVVFSGSGSHVTDTLDVGNYPFAFAAAPIHRRLYLGHLSTSFVYVLRDTVTGITEKGPKVMMAVGAIAATPNPFNRAVSLAGRFGDCPVRIYSPAGELVRIIPPTSIGSLKARAVWDGLGSDGRPVPEGVYLVEVAGRLCKLVKAK